jgi:hypothetical protein
LAILFMPSTVLCVAVLCFDVLCCFTSPAMCHGSSIPCIAAASLPAGTWSHSCRALLCRVLCVTTVFGVWDILTSCSVMCCLPQFPCRVMAHDTRHY